MKKTRLHIITLLILSMIMSTFSGCAGCNKQTVTNPTPTVAPTVEPTNTVAPTATPIATPTQEVLPTETVSPTNTPVPKPTVTAVPTVIPEPTKATTPTSTPKPTNTSVPTSTPKPTITPVPTATPRPTATPKPVLTVSETEVFSEKIAKAMGIDIYGTQTYTDALVANGLLSDEVAAKSAVSRKDGFVVLNKVAEKYNALDAGMMQISSERNRISDMKSCTEEEIQSAYALYSAGIVEGEMDGLYSHTRSMNPNAFLMNEDLDLYLNRIAGVAEKRVLSFDGQITRTANLPDARYAKWYAYFLESFPNEYYENEFPTMFDGHINDNKVTDESLWNAMQSGVWITDTGEKRKANLYFPVNLNGLIDYETKLPIEEWLLLYGEDATEFVEEYLMTLFNVDYRTTPDGEWADYIMNNWSVLHTSGYPDAEERYWKMMNEYLEAMEENKSILECSDIDCDLSSFSKTRGGYTVVCRVRYRIVSAEDLENEKYFVGIDGNNYCCLDNLVFKGFDKSRNTFVPGSHEIGEWKEIFMNVEFSTFEGEFYLDSIDSFVEQEPVLYK